MTEPFCGLKSMLNVYVETLGLKRPTALLQFLSFFLTSPKNTLE